jgi:hypothetical protein
VLDTAPAAGEADSSVVGVVWYELLPDRSVGMVTFSSTAACGSVPVHMRLCLRVRPSRTFFGDGAPPGEERMEGRQAEESVMTRTYRTLRVARSEQGVLGVVIDAPPMNLIGPEVVRDVVSLLDELETGGGRDRRRARGGAGPLGHGAPWGGVV